MRVGAELLIAGALVLFASTAQDGAPRPCMHSSTVAGVKYNTFCGPASVTLHIGGKTHRFTGGYCGVDGHRNFSLDVGSSEAPGPGGSAERNRILRLAGFSIYAAFDHRSGKYDLVSLHWVLPGDHSPGEGATGGPTLTVVGGNHGSFSARYSQPPISGTFHC